MSLFTGSSVSRVIENWPVVEFDSLAPNQNGSAYLIDFLGLSEEAETDVRFCINFKCFHVVRQPLPFSRAELLPDSSLHFLSLNSITVWTPWKGNHTVVVFL